MTQPIYCHSCGRYSDNAQHSEESDSLVCPRCHDSATELVEVREELAFELGTVVQALGRKLLVCYEMHLYLTACKYEFVIVGTWSA